MAGVKWSPQEVIDAFTPYFSSDSKGQEQTKPTIVNRTGLLQQMLEKARGVVGQGQNQPPANPMEGQE
jgi:hypothetical protein